MYDEVSTQDGKHVILVDGWDIIRPSGSESPVRITAQAEDDGRTTELVDETSSTVRAAADRG